MMVSFQYNSRMICCQPIAVNNLICAVLKNTSSIGNFHSCTDINILICIGQPAQPFMYQGAKKTEKKAVKDAGIVISQLIEKD